MDKFKILSGYYPAVPTGTVAEGQRHHNTAYPVNVLVQGKKYVYRESEVQQIEDASESKPVATAKTKTVVESVTLELSFDQAVRLKNTLYRTGGLADVYDALEAVLK